MSNDTPSEHSTATPPSKKEGFDLGRILFNLTNSVEELRIDFNNIGSGKDERMIDLVTARLVRNTEFHHAVARAIVEEAKAEQSRRQSQGVEQQPMPTAELADGQEMKLTPQSAITAGYYDFENNNGYVEIALDETGEGVVGGTIYPKNEPPRLLDASISLDAAIICAVDRSYRHVTTQEPIVHASAGDKFWYRVDFWTDPEPQPDGDVASVRTEE